MPRLPFESDSYRGTVFAMFATVVLLLSLEEIVSEFNTGERLGMFDDIAMFLVSAAIISMFCVDYFRQQRALKDLKSQLESVRGKLDSNSRSIGNQYRGVIQKQFEKWQLTPSEQEVALTLIKGLSFREVAAIRQTREKTVRQQAANVYKKAGLSGRHELAGWFFEDLFEPD